MNESTKLRKPQDTKPEMSPPSFYQGSSFCPSWIAAKACGNDGLAIYFLLEVLEEARNFQGEK
jgi:hypothetical protein